MTTASQPGATAQAVLSSNQAQKNTLVVGSEQEYPPFATGMTDAAAGGFTVDLWKAVAAEMGLNYTIRVLPFRQILQEFKEGKIDVLINLAHSDERHRFADFTVPHVVVHGAIFVRKGESAIRSENDFAGKSIIVLNADLAHDYAVSKGWEKQLVLVDTSAEGMRLLASGKHDAMLLGKLAGMQTLQGLGLTNIEALKAKAGFSQKFAFAVQEGQSELLGKLNEGMALTKSDGTYSALYDRWFGIYEEKEIGLRDFLKYLIPVVVVFLCIAGYFFYRRQVERAAAEKKYRDLYDYAPDMLLSVEAKTANIIDCNRTLLDATGYSRDELVGHSVLELYHPDCVGLARIAFQKFMDTKEVHGVELQLRRKDGSKIDVSLNATAVCDERGVILHSRSALRDITDRKAIQKQMERQLAFTEAVINAEVDALAVCHGIAESPYVRFTIWNPSMEFLTGYSMEEINRLGWYQTVYVDPEVQERARQRMERMRRGDHLRGEEWTITRKDGEHRIVQINTVIVAEDDLGTHTLAVMHDITERKHAEKELRNKTQLLDSIVENIPNMIFLKRASDLRFELFNHAGEMLLGHERADLLGRNDYDFFPKEQADFFVAKDRATLEQDNIVNIAEEPIETPRGTRVLHTRKLALKDEHGHPQYLLGISEDITERKEYEAELKRSNVELEQFSYAVSHDMRQPLRMISSYLQLLERSLTDQLDGEKRGYFDFAIEGAKRIDQMLVALLEYSRIGRMGEPPTWIESRALLDEALQFLQPAIGEAQARLSIEGDWPRILASHDEILRLIQNLIGNAIKYRIAGRTPEIAVTSGIVRNEWHLCVADNGVGIIPDQIKRLFQVFQRLQSREAYEGTGIGLALCRKIAEHHKGRIWAESAGEGQGSKFCVVLPVPNERNLTANGIAA